MAKKEKKWSSLTKAKKIEWLRGAIDKILTGMPRTAARTTKRLTDVNSMLSDKIDKLSAKCPSGDFASRANRLAGGMA